MVLMIGKSLIYSGFGEFIGTITLNPHIQFLVSLQVTFWLLLPLLGGIFWLLEIL
ncbi:MAG: hypothetical protein KME32_32475 [Mojavia pulchra JT2-VF2]|jgi:hypothetical protein|uniref:Uncharacterized protein n=1 Tax=Mojavia pulchra JT2-VF2 TaxID=287848 RepID=A0A951Q5J9_9NOST|nr:hypothetical protein [Mojavia pulchra JT2-VF2]